MEADRGEAEAFRKTFNLTPPKEDYAQYSATI